MKGRIDNLIKRKLNILMEHNENNTGTKLSMRFSSNMCNDFSNMCNAFHSCSIFKIIEFIVIVYRYIS